MATSTPPRARREFVDVATGKPQRPEPPGPETDGTAPTGRVVVDLHGVEVPIDEEDLLGRPTGEHPREQSYAFDVEGPDPTYPEQAKAKAKAKATRQTKPIVKPRAFRATFDSPAKAAKAFYDNNAAFLDNVRDPFDGLRDWMDGIEVGRGKSSRRLAKTPTGARILGQKHAATAIKQSIAYVFGQAQGRRWDAVDWREVERLGDALEPYFEPPGRGEPSQRGLYWRPVVGTATLEDLEQLSAAQREQYATWESAEEVRLALADLRDAYARNLDCIPPKRRRIVQRRIEEWNRWARDPEQIPAYACEPDEQTGGYTCNYPSVAGELKELRSACERDYDPDWAEPEGRAGAPGFPDLTEGPEDPRVEAAAAALGPDEEAGTAELEDLRLLASDGRAYGSREESIVEVSELEGVAYQLEYRTCGSRNRATGKTTCWCFEAFPEGGHGPYWYAYWRAANGRRLSHYIGKIFREFKP